MRAPDFLLARGKMKVVNIIGDAIIMVAILAVAVAAFLKLLREGPAPEAWLRLGLEGCHKRNHLHL